MKVRVADDLEIETMRDELPHIVIRAVEDDPYSETQSIIVYLHEVKHLVQALTDAAAFLLGEF
jgi:hypothetical protein